MLDIFSSMSWPEIAGVLAAFVLLFDRIAKMTPTKTDDKVLTWLYKIASVLGLNVSDNKGK